MCTVVRDMYAVNCSCYSTDRVDVFQEQFLHNERVLSLHTAVGHRHQAKTLLDGKTHILRRVLCDVVCVCVCVCVCVRVCVCV